MSETLNHFIDNLPSIALLLASMLVGWAIKEIFLKKTALTDYKRDIEDKLKLEISTIKQELKEQVDDLEGKIKEFTNNLQGQINETKSIQHKQHSDFTELKTDIKHITKMLENMQKHWSGKR